MDESTCNFMAAQTISKELDKAGFIQLDPRDEWDLECGGKYYMVKNDSAVFAFIVGIDAPGYSGFRIISSHSDSPGFKIKPNCEIYGEGGVVSLNVEFCCNRLCNQRLHIHFQYLRSRRDNRCRRIRNPRLFQIQPL